MTGHFFSWSQEKIPLDSTNHAQEQALSISDLDGLLWSARNAQASGFSSLAIEFYREALLEEALKGEKGNNAILGLASALLSNGQYKEAEQTLKQFSGEPTDQLFLRRAWATYQEREITKGSDSRDGRKEKGEMILKIIDQIDPSALPRIDQAWFFFLSGLLAEEGMLNEQVDSLFERANASAVSDGQRALFEAARYRVTLLRQVNLPDAIMLKKLRDQFVQAKEPLIRFQYGKLYAVALYQSGDNEQAAEIIRKMLSTNIAEDRKTQEQLLLLLGLISGADTEIGKQAFEDMLRLDESKEEQLIALQLLLADALKKNREKELEVLLSTLMDNTQPHRLLDVFHYVLAEIALRRELPEEAEQILKEQLLKLFPNSSLRKNAYYLLARIAWERNPRQYRIIADYFNQLRVESDQPGEKATLAVLVADCFFLNGDYENAADAYDIAIREMKESRITEKLGPLFFQRVQAILETGRLAGAQTVLDEQGAEIAPIYRWRAEWNWAVKMRALGRTDGLIARLRRILQEPQVEQIPLDLRLRLIWLEAEISMGYGEYDDVPTKADKLMDRLERSQDIIAPTTYAEIKAHALSLKGRAYLIDRQNELYIEKAFSIFKQLREDFPTVEPTILSYLVEARFHAENDRIVEAQKLLRTLADNFPDSRYAPIALYEAAIFAQQRGREATEEGPAKILEQLTAAYPDDDLVFYTRLRRADVARLNNNFGDALIIYEDILKQYPNHPEIYRASISRADCLFAQAGQNEDRLDEAIAAYERLFEQTEFPADLRAEAGFKWGYAVARQEDFLRAKMVYARVVEAFLKNPSGDIISLQANGPFWLSRCFFELAALLEQDSRWEEARNAYKEILAYGLPGSALAKDKINPSDK